MREWRAVIKLVKAVSVEGWVEHEPKIMITKCLGSTERKLGASGPGQASSRNDETQSFKFGNGGWEWVDVALFSANSTDVEASNNASAHGRSPIISDTVI